MTSRLIPLTSRHAMSRREMLKLLGTGVAALSTGCLSSAGDEEIVPYVAEPPELRPGTPLRYASSLVLDGFATGIIVETREGRPIKIDGNPAHPASMGGSTPWMQARILDLYDPQRSRSAQQDGDVTSWSALAQQLRQLPPGPIWLVLPPRSSPTIEYLIARIRERHDVHVVTAAAIDHRVAYRGSALVYGQPLELQLDLARAGVVLALDADWASCMPMSPAWARAAALRRSPDPRMSRLWVCEPIQTATGTLADERISVPAGDVVCVAIAIVDELRGLGMDAPALGSALVDHAHARLGAALPSARAAAADLAAHRGAGAVIVGDRQPVAVHALARWIDHACGNVGTTVHLTTPVLADPLGGETLEALVRGSAAAQAVIVIDSDPVYSASPALGLATALAAVPLSVHVGLHRDQTALACRAHVPLAHELEAWSDARAWDGTVTIGQPLLRPRFDTASPIDILAALAGESRDGRTLVRERIAGTDAAWTGALRAGVVADTQEPAVTVTPRRTDSLEAAIAEAFVVAMSSTVEIALAPSPQVGDGRFATNAWLQELPHPITKQTWGNAALMSRSTAARLSVTDEDLVSLSTPDGELTLPVLVVDGACDGSITVEIGHGRAIPSAPIADRIGGNAFRLRSGERSILRGSVRPLGARGRVIRTQTTMTEHGRDVAPVTTIARFRSQPDLLAHLRGPQVSLLPAQDESGVQWGMSIDTSICTGCSSCMVACQAENNIATVGPEEVARGRHMNWIRIDRYVHDDGSVVNEPMPCQHCEDAPCEYVCPVNATTHSPDGLNEQVYNRCVGTRFCSNNCPYKVRRFNWFQYEKSDERSLQYNPDVTVRSRGVMEKCTYCVQRIRRAEHQALVEHRAFRTGEVVTACQQACPTGAIQFGELHERGTLFAQLRHDARRFDVLHDLGTRPRTQYLAKITNPRSRR